MRRPHEASFQKAASLYLWNIEREAKRDKQLEQLELQTNRLQSKNDGIIASYALMGIYVFQIAEDMMLLPVNYWTKRVMMAERVAEEPNLDETMQAFAERRLATTPKAKNIT